MTDLDLAKLRRLKGAVDSLAADRTDDTFGRSAAYEAIRGQIISAVPEGLQAEATALAPELRAGSGSSLLRAKQVNDQARAHLQSLSGWLGSLISE
jgi:hypothetical protein